MLSDLIVYSGVGQYMVQLGGSIAEDPSNIVVLASQNITRTDIPKNVAVIKLNPTKNIFNYLRQLHCIIKKYDIEVVHCNHRKQTFLMKIYQYLYGRIAIVWTCHTVPYPNNWIKTLLGYYGHKTIAISTEANKWMQTELHIDQSQIDKITNGVDCRSLIIPSIDKAKLKEDFFRKKFNECIDGKITRIIVAHGRLDPIKGIDLLIEAFAQLNEIQKKNVKIVLSGDTNVPYYNELSSLIAQHGLTNLVFFAGWSASSEIFSIADLMVQTSHREGFALAALEAFFMKVPVIRTMVGGYEDMKDYCVGIPANDVKAIKQELNNWLSNPNCFNEMVEKAYLFALYQGTIKTMAQKTLETYKEAINYVSLNKC